MNRSSLVSVAWTRAVRDLVRFAQLALLLGVVGCSGQGGQEATEEPANLGGAGGEGSEGTGGSGGGLGGDGGQGGEGEQDKVRLTGAISKGPLILGSTVSVAPVDGQGEPDGQVFQTQTSNDLGEFAVNLTYRGPVSLEGSGYFYNEISGELSAAPIVLRAYAAISSAGTQSAFVNPVTHMAYHRIGHLMAGGAVFADAQAQAEAELMKALAISPVAPAAKGVDMNLLGGDDDGNAYVFAASSILTQAAKRRAGKDGSIEANLQALMNAIAHDLADDGAIAAELRAEVDEAKEALRVDEVMFFLERYLGGLGSKAAVPNLHRVLDFDGDGIPNLHDNCPLIANPKQEPMVGLCGTKLTFVELPVGQDFRELQFADLDGDGVDDIVAFSWQGAASLLVSGAKAPVVSWVYASEAPFWAMLVDDFDRDGTPDLLTEGCVHMLPGDGRGGFKAPESFPAPCRAILSYEDLDGDGLRDLVVAPEKMYHEAEAPDVWLGNANGFFEAPKPMFEGEVPIWASAGLELHAFEDLDGDGMKEAIGFARRFLSYYLLVMRGRGDGTFELPGAAGLELGSYGNTIVGVIEGAKAGRKDLLVGGQEGVIDYGELGVVGWDGKGGFEILRRFEELPLSRPALFDVTGDGRRELMGFRYLEDGNELRIHSSDFIRHLARIDLQEDPYSPIYALDVDLDGRPELLWLSGPRSGNLSFPWRLAILEINP